MFDLTGLDTGTLRAGTARIDAGGAARNLADPKGRAVTFDVSGALRDLSSTDPDLARALGGGFDLTARGTWAAGNPVTVEIAEVKNPNAARPLRRHRRRHHARRPLLAERRRPSRPSPGLVGQDLACAVTLDSNGTVTASTGAFALTLTSETRDLSIGNPTVDALLVGRTTLKAGGALHRGPALHRP